MPHSAPRPGLTFFWILYRLWHVSRLLAFLSSAKQRSTRQPRSAAPPEPPAPLPGLLTRPLHGAAAAVAHAEPPARPFLPPAGAAVKRGGASSRRCRAGRARLVAGRAWRRRGAAARGGRPRRAARSGAERRRQGERRGGPDGGAGPGGRGLPLCGGGGAGRAAGPLFPAPTPPGGLPRRSPLREARPAAPGLGRARGIQVPSGRERPSGRLAPRCSASPR